MSTIFVNQLQFAPNEDDDTYPHTLDANCAQLEGSRVVIGLPFPSLTSFITLADLLQIAPVPQR